jgi:hypothetical protein
MVISYKCGLLGKVKLMNESINVEFKELGTVDGMKTTQVINADTKEIIGYNQTAVEGEYNAN